MRECPKCDSRNVKSYGDYNFHSLFECVNCKSLLNHKFKDCCKNTYTIFVIEYYGFNDKRIFKQCLNCGGAFRKNKFPLKTHGDLIKSEFSVTNFDDWNSKRSAESIDIKREFDNFRESKFYKYHVYLKSVEWKIIRNKVVERDNGMCLYCKTKPAQEVHHKHYRTIYKEKIDDLESVCSDCHRAIHKSVFSEVLKGH
jgi:hypothetical protein